MAETLYKKLETEARAAQAAIDKARAAKEKASVQVEAAKKEVRSLLKKHEPKLVEYARQKAENERVEREAAGEPTPPPQTIGMEG